MIYTCVLKISSWNQFFSCRVIRSIAASKTAGAGYTRRCSAHKLLLYKLGWVKSSPVGKFLLDISWFIS
jgi:hypothetical protein